MTTPLLISLVLFAVLPPQAAPTDCRQDCADQMIIEEDYLDLSCNETCKISKCQRGCERWSPDAKETSCQSLCDENGEFERWVLYCVMGCHQAANSYLQAIEEAIGKPGAPYLVSRSFDSLELQWPSEVADGVTFLVQWRYEHSADWEYYEPHFPLTVNKAMIRGLHPYTKYRFRVAWIILPNFRPLLSGESIIISTLSSGVPSSSPVVTSLAAVGPNRISVTWDPPLFPNGPILSYVLYLRDTASGIVRIKDVGGSVVTEDLYFMFNHLQPNTTYSLSVTARNTVGEGPPYVRNVTTPEKGDSGIGSHSRAFLILSSIENVLMQGLSILDDPFTVFHTLNNSGHIGGISFHVKQEVAFVSDVSGQVLRVPIPNPSKSLEPLSIVTSKMSGPSLLSVDWLNNHIYIVEETQISRCHILGGHCEIVVTGFDTKPSDIEVDPCNGYLYWVLHKHTQGGLYRLDLDRIRNHVVSQQGAQLIVADPSLRAMAVDYWNFRLLLPRANSVESFALDGSDRTDVRSNTQAPQFDHLTSLATHDGLFYWTTESGRVFGEEFHSGKYYHNPYVLGNRSFFDIGVFHASSQPHPVPHNPVENVQAMFLHDSVKIIWSRPRLLGGLGRGAWQDWFYEVYLYDLQTEMAIFSRNISDTSYTLKDLRPETTYSLRVRAYSFGGKGPWSSTFTGKTLKPASRNQEPYILWSSSSEGLLRSDLVGDRLEPLLVHLDYESIAELSWRGDQLFISTNKTGRVFVCRHDAPPARVGNITHASALALEWLAPKLYWASPSFQTISRSNLDGSQIETLPLITTAREIAVDSISARLYWVSAHSVEVARLDGEDRHVYAQTGLFSGKYVMGLTLNLEEHVLYWMVRNSEGSFLYQAPLFHLVTAETLPENVHVVGKLQENDLQGPLFYFSDRLFWSKGFHSTLISDMKGQNVASIKGVGINGLKFLTVIDSSLQPFPEGQTEWTISVVPDAVADVRVQGDWSNFSLYWPAVINTNHGELFYELVLGHGVRKILTEPFYRYPEFLPPFSPITVRLRSFTYWGSSKQTTFHVRSPMSTPSQPLRPRAFAWHEPFSGASQLRLEFRWDPPLRANGELLGYRLSCWLDPDGVILEVCKAVVPPHVTRYILPVANTIPNATYFFQVQAYTEVGNGPRSVKVVISTTQERPVPELLLARPSGIAKIDMDSLSEKSLTNKASRILTVDFLADEERIFWIEENGALLASDFNGSSLTTIGRVDLLPQPSLAVDWVSRKLYWTSQKLKEAGSILWSLDLTTLRTAKILESSHFIRNLVVEPFSNSVILSFSHPKNDRKSSLWICKGDGEDLRPLLSLEDRCSCRDAPPAGNTLALDYRNTSRPLVLWAATSSIWAVETSGCRCHLWWNSTAYPNVSLAESFSVDSQAVYWLDRRNRSLFWVELDSDKRIKSHWLEDTPTIVRSFGFHLQPYPDPTCLVPLPYSKVPYLVRKGSTSFTLRLERAERPRHCTGLSFATVIYTLHYGPSLESNCSIHLKDCITQETANLTLVVEPLTPFTNYTLRVSVRNHFSPTEVRSTGPRLYVQTKEGAPSQPLHVQAVAATPSQIVVEWQPPAVSNGDGVWFQVHWRGPGDLQSGHLPTYSFPAPTYTTTLGRMTGNTTYSIFVRALSVDGSLYTDSDRVEVTTPVVPDNLTLLAAGPTYLMISWTSPPGDLILNHALEYVPLGDSQWHLLESETTKGLTKGDTQYNFTIQNLYPVTRYAVRVLLTYRASSMTFVWPPDMRLSYWTSPDKPSLPGLPFVREVAAGVFQVFWQEAEGHGGRFLSYELQCRILNDKKESAWQVVHNDSESHWVVSGLQDNLHYTFRVRAINELGASGFVLGSEAFFLPPLQASLMESNANPLGMILSTSLCSLFFILGLLISIYYFMHRKREIEKKSLQNPVQYLNPPSDLELATLRELPLHGNFVHQNNVLYAINEVPTDEELAALPQISREQITLTKFLGSGAFGEVFEGEAHNLNGPGSGATRVAIKTLRKGAKDHEKEEFLKEAKLMSHFQHEHILQLLGICLDNNPNFLILELMEGGDLLSFLRAHRPASLFTARPALAFADLVALAVDVARGCRYLEEMHFVHRDLAARNCLVSSPEPGRRLVKIGDFGLARDIYKHDYYRKEGEGLLPVRWMAPESLIDGVFTCQSDVWSFGVLLWEVMTLGQKPYPARTNPEVLHYVRNGGRPEAPEDCPPPMHDLMSRCWSFQPEDRPTFVQCLDILLAISASAGNHPLAVHNHNYLTRDGNVEDNVAPRKRERNVESLSTASLSTEDEEERLNEDGSSHVLEPQPAHSRYLELLGDAQDADGYEIPLSTPQGPYCREPSRASELSDLSSASPPPSYTQVARNGYLTMLPVIASALRKPPSSHQPSTSSVDSWASPSTIKAFPFSGTVEIPYFPNSSLC